MSCNTCVATTAAGKLAVVTEGRAGVLIVRIKGSAAFEQAEQLDRQLQLLAKYAPRRVVFDLAELTEVSSLFLGALVRFRAASLRRGGEVRLANVPPQVRLLFEITRLVDLFPMEEVA
jgi:anti-anti-sigma factor